ncbi:unnamed protein product [Colias eurytheme]|nr:unnamed protein product [Colias eurytheme]
MFRGNVTSAGAGARGPEPWTQPGYARSPLAGLSLSSVLPYPFQCEYCVQTLATLQHCALGERIWDNDQLNFSSDVTVTEIGH